MYLFIFRQWWAGYRVRSHVNGIVVMSCSFVKSFAVVMVFIQIWCVLEHFYTYFFNTLYSMFVLPSYLQNIVTFVLTVKKLFSVHCYFWYIFWSLSKNLKVKNNLNGQHNSDTVKNACIRFREQSFGSSNIMKDKYFWLIDIETMCFCNLIPLRMYLNLYRNVFCYH